MNPPLALLAPLLMAALIVFTLLILAKGRREKTVGYPYVAAEGLFTPNERHFLAVLEGAAGTYRVFGKVRVADVIAVRKGLSKGERQGALNRLTQKHLDFVLCDPHSLSVVCAVELDDRTHGRADQRARDAFLEVLWRRRRYRSCGCESLPLRRDRSAGAARRPDGAKSRLGPVDEP